jgi:hypothetical protein
MKDPTNRPDSTATRRLLVTLTITFAVATVMAGVALNHRPSHAAAAPTSPGVTTAVPAGIASPSAALPDPSVPDAYEAFRQGVSQVSEQMATF